VIALLWDSEVVVRAIVSVSDKTGLLEFVRGLAGLGVEVFSTGGTQTALSEAGVPVRPVSALTGFPEILDGRVKTLHPAIHGGILARRDLPEHLNALQEHGLATIDIVVVNLYPFAATVAKPGVTLAEAIENVDIGGPSMLRSAAKNFAAVTVVVDPADYPAVLDDLRQGGTSLERRRALALKVFQHTAAYDAQIAAYLQPEAEPLPALLTVPLFKLQDLRYGENPHQQAAVYADRPPVGRRSFTLAGARQLHGKELSFTNTLDLDAALACVREFAAAAVAIIKHGNPCGLAVGEELLETFRRAYAGDPVSAFGGAIGLNRVVDGATAAEIGQSYFEDIVAPGYEPEALAILQRKRDLRILAVDFVPADPAYGAYAAANLDYKRISGGFLVQTADALPPDGLSLKVVSARRPTLDELTDLQFAWQAVKFVKSNAIVLAKRLALVGVGAGQMSRVDSVAIAARKAGEHSVGSVLASDAFFPKPDGLEAAADAGVTAIIQPGGSIRDEDVVKVANTHHMAMVFTGRRHFRH